MPCVAISATEYCAPAPRVVRGNRYDHARKPTHALALEPGRTGKNGHRVSRERKQEAERYSRQSFRNDSPPSRSRARVIVEKSLESSKSELGNTSPKSQSLVNTEQRVGVWSGKGTATCVSINARAATIPQKFVQLSECAGSLVNSLEQSRSRYNPKDSEQNSTAPESWMCQANG
jgi:hypothetical protein